MKRMFLLCWFLATPALAYTPPAVHELVTPRGITVWMVEDHSLPIVSAAISFRESGSAYDPPGKIGRAALAAKLLDEGAGDLTGIRFKQVLEDYAIELGASVSYDDLTIRLKMLSENQEKAFELLALMLTQPQFEEKTVERVKKETLLALSKQQEDPGTIADLAWRKTAFGTHPYAWDTKGAPETISRISRRDLVNFAGQLTRANMVVSIAGDISREKAAQLVDAHLGKLPVAYASLPLSSPPDIKGSTVTINRDNPQSVVIFGQKAVDIRHPDYWPMMVLNYVLGGGSFSSRLIHEIRETRGLVYGAASSIRLYDKASLLMGTLATKPASVDESLKLTRQIMQSLQKDGITKEELEAAKGYLIGSFALHFDSTAKLANMLDMMQMKHLPSTFLAERNQLLVAVTLEEVKRVAENYLTPDNLAVAIVGAVD